MSPGTWLAANHVPGDMVGNSLHLIKRISYYKVWSTLVGSFASHSSHEECRSLPLGPELTGEEFFAGERLGYS